MILESISRVIGAVCSKLKIGAFDRAVIIWAPGYDPTTERTSHWLDGLSVPIGAIRHISIGTDIDRDEVSDTLQATQHLKRVKIFFGHGIESALLGPPEGTHSDISLDDKTYSVIYDAEMVGETPSALFAFACHAGKSLGERFCLPAGRSFLGFTDGLVLPIMDKECRDVWRNIIRTIASQIIHDGTIEPKHEESLRELYNKYFVHFQRGTGKQNAQAAFLMTLHLNYQSDVLSRYP